MRISDWSSDVCASDLASSVGAAVQRCRRHGHGSLVVLSCPVGSDDRVPQVSHLTLTDRGAIPERKSNHSNSRVDGAKTSTESAAALDRQSVVEGKSVSGRVYLGGSRIDKTNTT